jgi:predicted enzyme related to lactoylglutathione lyase
MSNRIVHFEIHCPNLDTATKFYAEVFGWKLTNWGGPEKYVLAETGDATAPGINGGLMPSRDGQPRTVNTIQVENVDAAVKKPWNTAANSWFPKWQSPAWAGWPTAPTPAEISSV